MAETYIITAKTVKEAIEIANREYADENHEVTYDILEMPKKGFLGIGAKDAKIKITVTKTVSLDSIVSDLRSLKVFTDKGEGGEKQPKQNEKKPQNNRQNGQNNQKSRENSEKQAAPQSEKSEKKPQNAQPKAEKPQQNNAPKAKSENGEKPQQNQPKQKKEEAVKNEKPQNSESKQQPKAEKKQANAEKPQQNNQPKAKSENAASQPEKKAEAAREKIHAEKAPAEEAKAAPEVKAEVKEQKKEEKRSSLNNQGKPSRRQHQKPSSEQNIEASAVAVSTPMGLSDFVPSENNASFGSANEKSSSGRMSNDIRKAKKNQPKAEKPQQNNQVKAGGKNERVIYEDRKSMITRYDVAESDDDYKKLDSLEARDMTIDEIRESVKCQNVREEVPAVEEAVEIAAAPVQKSRREAVSEAEMTFALEFANTLLKNMGLDASAVPAECPEGEEFDTKEGCTVYPKINIIGDDTGILIGHHGETLDSIQYLVNLSALRKSKQKDGDYVKIVVDIENYREKREETLRVLARRMAAKAVKYKRNVFLEPMNAYERRIIHSELQNVENVSTHSVGTDRDRKIIITYEGTDKAPENKNRRRRNPRPHNDNVNGENAGIEAAETTESGEKAQGSGSNRERRRPKKVQKMPIEKIGDILPDSDSAESEE